MKILVMILVALSFKPIFAQSQGLTPAQMYQKCGFDLMGLNIDRATECYTNNRKNASAIAEGAYILCDTIINSLSKDYSQCVDNLMYELRKDPVDLNAASASKLGTLSIAVCKASPTMACRQLALRNIQEKHPELLTKTMPEEHPESYKFFYREKKDLTRERSVPTFRRDDIMADGPSPDEIAYDEVGDLLLKISKGQLATKAEVENATNGARKSYTANAVVNKQGGN